MATTQFNFRAFIEGIDALYALSQRLGYVQTRGGRGRGGKGEGSPKLLMEAIAAGRVLVVPIAITADTDRNHAAQRLRALAGNARADCLESPAGCLESPVDAALITALADALESAGL